jgi:FixJ family two-component response regulator
MVMPGMNGAELQAEMARRGIDLPIIFLSGQGDIPTTVRAMREGALDFLTKPVTLPVLIQAIDAALARDAENHRLALERRELRSRLEKLSAREREVLDLALAGLQNKEIARDLGLSHRTVEVHRSRIFLKLGVTSLMEAMRLIASIGGMPTKRSGAPGQDGTREA